MATFELTSGNDTIVGTSDNDTVNATAKTLNPGDRLTGGGGTDTLVLNGPGTFVLETLTGTPIETSGATRLDQVANEFYLRDGAGNGPSLKYAGADVVAGQFGGWTPIGVEKVGSGYQVVWKNGGADQYTVWNLDSNGNYASSATGWVSGTDKTLQAFETPFQQDLNGDGTTGLKTTPIETSGTARLDQVVNEFFLHDGGGNGPSLKYLGSAVTTGQFGAWTPVGVEKVGGGYQVVWKNGGADQCTVWNLDSNGNYASSATGHISSSDAGFTSWESAFQQDLNGDGVGLAVFAISALAADKAEGNSGTTPFTFTITRTGDTGSAQSVFWSLSGSGANPASASDLVGGALPSGTLSFAAGETSKTVTINVAADAVVESSEGFTVTLSNPSTGATLGTGSAIGTIRNDDAVLSIATASADKAEGQSGTTPFTFTITRTGDTGSAHSVAWSLTGSGASQASASDFVGNALPSGTVSFAAGETSKTITVNIAGDTVVESDEGFTVTLSNPSTGATLGTASAVGTIRTDDASSPGTGGDNTAPVLQSINLSTSQLDFGSGQKSLVVTVHLSDDISGLFDGTFGGALASISFRSPSGQYVSGNFDLQHPVSGDQLDGTFQATIQLPANAEAGTWTVQSLYMVDEAGNSRSLSPVTTPALGSTTFQVLNGASDNTAPALQSISLSTGQLDFGSGQKSLVVTVHLSDDISGLFDGTFGGALASISFRSPSGQYVSGNFDLQHPVSGNQLDGTFQATIQLPANAEAGTWTVQSLYMVDEAGNSRSLSPVTTPALGSTTFQVLNGASDNTAPALQSISLSTGQLDFGSGQKSLVVTVHLSDDISGLFDGTFGGALASISFRSPSGQYVSGNFDLQHPVSGNQLDGTFQATIQLPANAEAGTWTVQSLYMVDEAGNSRSLSPVTTPALGSTTFQVLNSTSHSAVFSVESAQASQAEGQSGATPFTFTVTRIGDTGSAHSVFWSLTGSGANPASASDFVGNVLPSGTVSFAAGETSKTVTVNIAGDTVVESDEGFTVTLSNPSTGATLGTASAIGTIRNDDAVLSIATASADKAEGQSGTTPFTFTITRTGDTGSAHSVLWSLAGSGANPASASDFVGNALPSGKVSFAAGETSKTVTVNVAGDTVVESDEGFTVTLSNPSTGATLGTASASGAIRNDDTSSPGTGSDSTAPALQSISLSTTQLNIGSGQTSLVVTAHLSDDISGLSDGGIGEYLTQILFRSPSGQTVWGTFDVQHPVSGNLLDGTFKTTVQLPANAEAGTWTVEWLLVADEAGNLKYLHPSDTPLLSSTTFQVLNGASDSTAPALQSISLSTTQLNIGSGQTSLVVTAHLSDDISGLSDGGIGEYLTQILFRSPSGQTVWGTFDVQHPVSGNLLDGTFKTTVQLPANAEAGTWTVEWLLVADEAGNLKYLHPSDTPLLSSTTFQVLNNASHSAAFSVEPAQASQSESASATTADTFTATVVEDDDGALTASDGQSHDRFDGAAALSSDGSTAIVGHWSDDVGANADQGSAQVFVREGGDWTQRGAALTASDGQAEDWFGQSDALSSDGRTAIIGGPGDDVGGHADQGSARVLAWDGNAWTQRGGAITPGDGQAGDHFGVSVALSSDGLTVIVGGPQHNVGANMDQGSAYVFAWDGCEWVQRGDALTFSEGGPGSHLGSSVALSADGLTATVGATEDNAPLVLHWDGSHWI